jgi:hexosaminidase
VAISGAQISGAVAADDSATLSICSTRLTGPVSVTASTGYILAGSDSPACGADTITGPLTLARNTGGLELADSTVYGPVLITRNTGNAGITGIDIDANHIHGNLTCLRNTPAPADGGHPNTVTGYAAGQCAALA